VTLSGHVTSWTEREDAEAAAWAAPGVMHVNNMLTVHG
jgi:osmotically-inducible protein OsmY